MLGAVEIGRGQSPQGFANGGRHPEQSLMRRERLPNVTMLRQVTDLAGIRK